MTGDPSKQVPADAAPLLNAQASPVLGPLLLVAGGALVVLAAVALARGDSFGLLLLPLSAMLGAGGFTLGARRGGLWLEPGAFVLGGDSASSRLRVPASPSTRVVRRAVEEHHRASTGLLSAPTSVPVVRHSIELERPSGLCVLLAEADDPDALTGLADAAHAHIEAAVGAQPGASTATNAPPLPDGEHVIRVGSGTRLGVALFASGGALLGTGAALLFGESGAATRSFVGVPLMALGGLFVIVVAVKALASEVLSLDGPRWTHGWRLGPLRWFEFNGTADANGGVRLRQRGLHGATLELVGGGRVHLLAGGVQGATALGPEALLALGDALARWHAKNSPERGSAEVNRAGELCCPGPNMNSDGSSAPSDRDST